LTTANTDGVTRLLEIPAQHFVLSRSPSFPLISKELAGTMASAHSSRVAAIVESVTREGRKVAFPRASDGSRPAYTSEIFGEDVFGKKEMEEFLPKPVYSAYLHQIHGKRQIEKGVADAIAHAVRVWAMNKGATHFTHWFQPQTGSTAEKHDSFLSMKIQSNKLGGMEMDPIDTFSGSQLLQSEPDASSFPSGGMRTTFEARGYTVWDTHSPMFIRRNVHGSAVLYIPCVYISYNGEALDEKTVLLRSHDSLNKSATKLLNLIGVKANSVSTTLGTEQEFFLVDRSLYAMRPDMRLTGRTLVGNVPPKHQQLEDHYFGRMPSKVMSVISEAELELYRLGVPIKTRHNEVAPGQFEMAPVFEEANIAVDHNMLIMDVVHKVAHRHKLKALFHEKPFAGVNGSGKHCNWSMSTDTGINLLDPTREPENCVYFLVFLVATLYAVHEYSSVLRTAIASSSNDHRLGAHEAPPAIISAFLGDQLTEVLNAIEEGRDIKRADNSQSKTISLPGTGIDLKVSTLPSIDRDLTDRNRTSPFAFTGNKFEFRAVGSKQSPSFPTALLTAAVAHVCNEIYDKIKGKIGSKEVADKDTVMAVVKEYIGKSKAVRFEGDNYSDDWRKDAAKRGLPNLESAPDAFSAFLTDKNVSMLQTTGVFSKEELQSRINIMNERYVKDLIIEGNTMYSMVNETIMPAIFDYRSVLASNVERISKIEASLAEPETTCLKTIQPHLVAMQKGNAALRKVIDEIENMEEGPEQSHACNKKLRPAMDAVREASDMLETIVADKHWPYPKYLHLLY